VSRRIEITRQSADPALPLGGEARERGWRAPAPAPPLEPTGERARSRTPALRVGRGARRVGATHSRIVEAHGSAATVRRDAFFRRTLLLADVAAIAAAFSITRELAGGTLRITWVGIFAVAAFLVVAKMLGLYDRDEALLRKTTLEEAPRLFNAATLYVLITFLASGRLLAGPLTHNDVLFLWLSLVGLLILARACARVVALRISPPERCLFIGDEDSAAIIRSKLLDHGGTRASVVAHLDLDKVAMWSTDDFSTPRLAEIRDLARSLDVDRAIIAPRSADGAETLDLVRTLKAIGVRVSLVPRMLEVVGSSVEFDDLHGVTMMGVRRFDLTRTARTVKRAFDLAGACLGLIVMGPVMIAIAIAIKLDSRGSALFKQRRVGRHGEQFWMVKFRTMVPGADLMKDSLRAHNEAQDGLFKIADDPRVTRVGALLRRTALDELPQLINVLKGEMSLVGPRPLVIEEDHRIEGWDRRRLDLMPGMTGPWQILGPTRAPLREMGAMDYLYVANWSLWSDVKILLRTLPHVLCRRGL
jgi:exopolysaccharide biosynthesis polyprenyl glycosylphosphotransferase